MKMLAKSILVIFVLVSFTACGGGGGGGGSSTPTVDSINDAIDNTSATRYVNVDFSTEVTEVHPEQSDLSEFIQFCETCDQ